MLHAQKLNLNATINPKNGRITKCCTIKNDYELKVREELFDSGDNSDVKFLVGEKPYEQKTFYVHRFILVTASRKFREIFNENQNKEIIELPKVNPDEFEVLLKAIYFRRLELKSIRSAVAYGKIFEEYELKSAAKECYEYLNASENTNEVTAVSVYEAIGLNSGCKDVLQNCLNIFRTKTRYVLASDGFLYAKPETILQIFVQPQLAIVSETDLLTALENYAKIHEALPNHNIDRFQKIIRPALCQIRFLTLCTTELIMCSAAKALLTTEEQLAILTNLIFPENSDYPYPKDFSVSTVNRAKLQFLDSFQLSQREQTALWDVSDLAKRVNPTPPRSALDIETVVEEHPLGNSTFLNLHNSTYRDKSTDIDISKVNSTLSETPVICKNAGSYAPSKNLHIGQKSSPLANSLSTNGEVPSRSINN